LKATACETIPHFGITLANVRKSLFATECSAIAGDYSVRECAPFCTKGRRVSNDTVEGVKHQSGL